MSQSQAKGEERKVKVMGKRVDLRIGKRVQEGLLYSGQNVGTFLLYSLSLPRTGALEPLALSLHSPATTDLAWTSRRFDLHAVLLLHNRRGSSKVVEQKKEGKETYWRNKKFTLLFSFFKLSFSIFKLDLEKKRFCFCFKLLSFTRSLFCWTCKSQSTLIVPLNPAFFPGWEGGRGAILPAGVER